MALGIFQALWLKRILEQKKNKLVNCRIKLQYNSNAAISLAQNYSKAELSMLKLIDRTSGKCLNKDSHNRRDLNVL